jgi:tRNA modification GTPase
MVLEVLRRQGAVVIDSKRWIGTRPPSRQALELLSRAPTLRTAEHLLDQADGALDRELARIAERAIEAPEAAREALANLLEHARVGLRLIEGWKIALAGPPNVGKSCLLNALAGYPRAIVDPTPGTTRDAVTHQTAFDGWPVQVVDTAGLRQTDQPLEALGIAQARRLHQRTDLVLLVLDGSIPLSQNERDLLRRYPQALVVANKADRPAAWSVDALGALAVSALSGAGLPELTARVARDLVPRPPRELTPLPFLDSHVRRLRAFQTLLKRGQGDRVTALIRRWLDPSIASWSRGGMESVPGRHRREERVCRRPDGPGRA